MGIVRKFNNGIQENWSPACSKGVPGMGYTCGLWELFHIIVVSFSERHSEKGVYPAHLTPALVARCIRNYIEHFFACEECRRHFLDSFDACFLDHCSRLSDDAKNPRELALWLWEFHNAVNVRLLEEESKRNNRTILPEEKFARLWPSKDLCSACWSDIQGKWDKTAVYEFLRETYGCVV